MSQDPTAGGTPTSAPPVGGGEAASTVTTPAITAPAVKPAPEPPKPSAPIALSDPAFIDKLRYLYSKRGKRVVVLLGNTHDLFPAKDGQKYVSLDQLLIQVFGNAFNMVRIDHAEGFQCSTRQDRDNMKKVWQRGDEQLAFRTTKGAERLGDFDAELQAADSPLAALMMLREVCRASNAAREVEPSANPVCAVFQFAGSMFPAGDFEKLEEVNKSRLVHLLNLVENPSFRKSHNLLILVADNASELNAKLLGMPSVATLEIEAPNAREREAFVQRFKSSKADAKPPTFEKPLPIFIEDTQGFTLNSLQDILEEASLSDTPITRDKVVDEMNRLLRAELGDIISIKIPDHGPEDIIGFEEERAVLDQIFKASEDPSTAGSSMLVVGPSGEGKTFLLEAYAAVSGRLVIELKGLRSMWFGQTDVLLEKLTRVLRRYNKLLALIDEADTQFGRVDNNDTQDTEKRLVGGMLRLMSDATLAGRVLWALMTSRPECLAPDMKSRAADQIPIFPLRDDKRRQYIQELLRRKKLEVAAAEFDEVIKATEAYSNRDLTALVKKAKGFKLGILDTLKVWGASGAIIRERRLQTLRAALHCTYPKLLPADLKKMVDDGTIHEEIEGMRVMVA
jgi:SpoVK/Ycf46/Vps4 family AAA+-type ATPase